MRNALNYNHEYGVWFPYNDYDDSYDSIARISEMCFNSPSDGCFKVEFANDLIMYAETCQFINSLNYSIMDDLICRHPENKSFLRNGFGAYRMKYCPRR